MAAQSAVEAAGREGERNGIFWEAGLGTMIAILKIYNAKLAQGCKWSSLNAPGTEIPLSHSNWENSIFPFSAFPPRGNKNWPQHESENF